MLVPHSDLIEGPQPLVEGPQPMEGDPFVHYCLSFCYFLFYLKMKGDYYRYLAEFKVGNGRKEAAEDTMLAYKAAQKNTCPILSAEVDPGSGPGQILEKLFVQFHLFLNFLGGCTAKCMFPSVMELLHTKQLRL